MEFPAPPNVVGKSLSGSEPYLISAKENRALCASLGVTPAVDGSAHPAYYYIATQVGMGVSVAGLCELCDFDVEIGPMMAGSRVKFFSPIKTDHAYRVDGEIRSINRKPSRKLGVMDLVEYELRLVDDSNGEAVLSTINSWVLPRRELA